MESLRVCPRNPAANAFTPPYRKKTRRISSTAYAQAITVLSAKLAFQFLILTSTRTAEVLGRTWDEIKENVWTLPAERTKPKREIEIPLCPRCLEILTEARTLSDGRHYVFPGFKEGKHLSNMVFLMGLRHMGLEDKLTAYGFRSTFTDWAHETTNFPGSVLTSCSSTLSLWFAAMECRA